MSTTIILDIGQELSTVETAKYQEILVALIASGGLSGVKGGQTILHFDKEGLFMGVQLSYWPWRRRNLARMT